MGRLGDRVGERDEVAETETAASAEGEGVLEDEVAAETLAETGGTEAIKSEEDGSSSVFILIRRWRRGMKTGDSSPEGHNIRV